MKTFDTTGSHCAASLAIAILALAHTGCGDKATRVAVHGTISYDGEPIETGQIAFQPQGSGKVEFSVISDGKYAIPKEVGVAPGDYIVKITGDRPTGEMADPDSFVTVKDSLVINEQFVPPKYNSASELTVTIEPLKEVTHDFSLRSN